MNGRDLVNKLNKQWQRNCDAECYINTTKGLVPLADVDYDEENNSFVMIPEGNGCVVMNGVTFAGVNFSEVKIITAMKPDEV